MTERDKRTVGFGVLAIAIYLACFYGPTGWRKVNQTRTEYLSLVKQAQAVKQELEPYARRAADIQQLMATYKLDPAKLVKARVVAEASAAIQKAASGGVQLGPIRESAGRPAARELASMQMEASGQVPAVLAFLHRLGTLGYPLVVESVQITAGGAGGGRPGMAGMPGMGGPPGMIKLTLVITILDYEQWKLEELRHV